MVLISGPNLYGEFVDTVNLVLKGVELNSMKVYALHNGKEPVLEIEVDTVPWLPVKPRIHRAWLKLIVETALRRYFQRSGSVVKA